ncbi:YiiX/YebB-like N1pC/P60 family cysteine hydrolase [Geomonas azotofigens]|uniref:YiiX/YebB-like N1pC/P60 family cysteine hydrolase n=1 Tax=Geomonas azotofigens TaxID=2843196 RepID=UPI001C122DF1|nr:YiiX/YebB-like N1pC/P60 family cysteine hydrolase [Geomonas azotofigens]MBU5612140.1 Poxvirus G6 [Geomonas azotofigens]
MKLRLCILISFLFSLSCAIPALAADTLKDLALKGLCSEGESNKPCTGHFLAMHGCGKASVEQGLTKELTEFRTLAEEALSLRAETIKTGVRIKQAMDQGKPLTGDDLALINQGIIQHMALREKLLALAQAHECWLDAGDKELARLGVTPESRLKGIMLSLSSALVLYDNYLLAVSLFEGDSKLRRILNERDPGYAVRSAELAKVTMSYDSISNRQRVRRAIKFYEKQMRKSPFSSDTLAMDYVSTLIRQSPSYDMVKKWSPFYVVGRKLGFFGAVTTDTVLGLEREGTSLFSMIFGNAVGLVETRKGKLYGREEVRAEVQKTLQAGDILLEKTPFRLTDKLIPGYWGHAAVWAGSEAELKELGIWDHPVVRPYQEQIRSGHQVIEALRSGVEMNTMQHFLNIDSIGIMRKTAVSRADRANTVIQALRQVGKPYDFNFDVESKGRVYCSKLVYMCYSGVEWPTKKSLGRATFTPDDVAIKAVKGGSLQLVTFYHEGSRVAGNQLETMAKLMGVNTGSQAAR